LEHVGESSAAFHQTALAQDGEANAKNRTATYASWHSQYQGVSSQADRACANVTNATRGRKGTQDRNVNKQTQRKWHCSHLFEEAQTGLAPRFIVSGALEPNKANRSKYAMPATQTKSLPFRETGRRRALGGQAQLRAGDIPQLAARQYWVNLQAT